MKRAFILCALALIITGCKTASPVKPVTPVNTNELWTCPITNRTVKKTDVRANDPIINGVKVHFCDDGHCHDKFDILSDDEKIAKVKAVIGK